MALLALCCAQILWEHGYVYVPGSFGKFYPIKLTN